MGFHEFPFIFVVVFFFFFAWPFFFWRPLTIEERLYVGGIIGGRKTRGRANEASCIKTKSPNGLKHLQKTPATMLVYISETRLKRVKHLRAWQENEKKGNRAFAPLPVTLTECQSRLHRICICIWAWDLGSGWKGKKKKNGRKIDEFNETWRGKHS